MHNYLFELWAISSFLYQIVVSRNFSFYNQVTMEDDPPGPVVGKKGIFIQYRIAELFTIAYKSYYFYLKHFIFVQ